MNKDELIGFSLYILIGLMSFSGTFLSIKKDNISYIYPSLIIILIIFYFGNYYILIVSFKKSKKDIKLRW